MLELSRVNEPEIGDVDEGVVEGSEDTSNAENELTCDGGVFVSDGVLQSHAGHAQNQQSRRQVVHLPSRAWGPKEMFSWAGRVVVFLGGILKLSCWSTGSLTVNTLVDEESKVNVKMKSLWFA